METIRAFADAWMPLFGIHMLEVSLFILLVWLADRVLRLDTRLRYGLWLLALAKVFVPPLFFLPAPPALPLAAFPVSVLVQATPRDQPADPGPVLAAAAAKRGSTSTPPGAKRAVPSLIPPLSVLVLGSWVAFAMVMAAVTAYQNLSLRRRLRRATPISISDFGFWISEWESFMGVIPQSAIRNPQYPRLSWLQVYSADTIQAPVLVGFRQPRLYLPEDWTAWPEAQVKGILAHEMAHLRGRDPYVLAFQAVALILFGLNPLVWVMYTRLLYLRELRCDETAIGATGIDPIDYSKLLYLFVQRQAQGTRVAVTGVYFSEHHLAILKRFQHILTLKEGAMKPRTWWHYAAPALLGLAILPFSIQGVEPGSATPDTGRPVEKPTVMHSSWVGVSRGPTPTDLIEGMVPIVIKAQTPYGPYRMVRTESGDSVLAAWRPRPRSGMDIPKPTFPESAYTDTTARRVELDLLIGEDGRVKEIRAIKGGEPFLQATIDYLKQTVWEPARVRGKPISAWLTPPFYTTFPIPVLPEQEAEMNRPRPDDYIPKMGEFIQVDEQPEPIKSPRTKYPEAMMKQGIEGEVWLQLLIGRDGKVLQAQTYKGDERFKDAAVEAARESVWKPATRKGKPVAVWVMYPTRFSLGGPSAAAPLARPGKVLPESGDSMMVDQLPIFVKKEMPRYPEAALKAGAEGAVYVKLLVEKDGKLSRMKAVSGPEVFHQAAVDAVREWSWTPAANKGQPISAWMKVPVRFRLTKYRTEAGDSIAVQDTLRPLRLPLPTYPEAALRDSLEGVVWLNILVDKDGHPKQTEILQKGTPFKGEDLFKQAALDAVKTSQWEPFTYLGKPIAIWVTYPVRFTMK